MKPLAIAAMLAATPALSAEGNTLTPSEAALATGVGMATTTPAPGGNVLTLSLHGDRNGGTGAFAPLLAGFPAPGALTQRGTGNTMALTVRGDDTLFAVKQIGADNRAFLSVEGAANQAALVQRGTANIARVAQVGHGNVVAIRQSGR